MNLPPQPWLHAPALRDQALAGAVVAAITLAFYWSPLLPLTVLLGAALLYLFWQRLDLGLLVVLASAPFYRFPKLYDQGGLGALLGREGALEVSLAESALILCLLAWGLRRFFQPDIDAAATGKSPFTDPAVWLPPAVLIAAAVVTLPFTEHLSVALREFRVVVVGPSLYYLMLVHTLRKEQDVGTFMWALALLGGAIGLYSLYHYLFVGVVESTGGVDRVLAVYHSPNALALFLGRVIPVAAALMLAIYAQQAARDAQRFWKPLLALGGVSLALMAGALYLTYSRGALLGIAAAMLVLLFGLNRRSAFLVLGALAVAGAVALIAVPQDRLLAAAPLLQRLYVWQAALAMVADHPIVGVGLDNFLYYYPRYILPQAALEPNVSHAHNVFLDYWTRLGILGLITLTFLQGLFWGRVRNFLIRPVAPYQRWLVLGLAASMVDFLVHGLIDNSYFLIDLALIFWLTFALMTILHRTAPQPLARGSQL